MKQDHMKREQKLGTQGHLGEGKLSSPEYSA